MIYICIVLLRLFYLAHLGHIFTIRRDIRY